MLSTPALNRVEGTFNYVVSNTSSKKFQLVFIPVSACLATQITSNYKIRIAVVLGAAAMPSVASRLQKLFYKWCGRDQYLDRLGKDPIHLLTQYFTGDDQKKLMAGKPTTKWEERLRAGFKEKENAAKLTLEGHGIRFYEGVGESAVECLERYRKLADPTSLLFEKSLVFKNTSLPFYEKICRDGYIRKLLYGPVLVLSKKNPDNYEEVTGIHWATGNILWQTDIVASRSGGNDNQPYISFHTDDGVVLLDVRSGQKFPLGSNCHHPRFLYEIKEPTIKGGPRVLIIHGLDEPRQIILPSNFDSLCDYVEPYLCYLNDKKQPWIHKEGENERQLTNESFRQVFLLLGSTYVVTEKGLYDLQGKKLLSFDEEYLKTAALFHTIEGDLACRYTTQDLMPDGRKTLDLFESHNIQTGCVKIHQFADLHFRSIFQQGSLCMIVSSFTVAVVDLLNPSSKVVSHNIFGRFVPGHSQILSIYDGRILALKDHQYVVIDLLEQSVAD